MNLVGIDFSINSPSFCCLKDNNYVWGSLTRSDRTEDSLKKNSKKPFFVLGDMENLRFIFLNKKELPSEYSERERIKIEYFLEIVDNLWEAIVNEMGDEPFRVAMEGLSFSSNGNSLVDIAMATALLRERIINKIGVENFHVFSPTSIKKFAVKGNAKKDELYYALVDLKEEGTNMNELTQVLAENQEEWITPKKVVNKPVDDIVDATWILLFLKNNLK
jgi:Holliday junction resolvasome RuvABC endonuclease subunit